MPKLTRRNFMKSLGVGALAGVGTGALAQDCSDWLSLEHTELKLARWNAEGFKVGLIADFHMNSPAERDRAQKAVAMTVAEKPDLIVIAGDFVNKSDRKTLDNIPVALQPISDGSIPCVAVMGNHDYWCQHPALIVETVNRCKVKMLKNEMFELQGVSVAGLDDAFEGLESYEFFPENRVSCSCLAVLHEPDYVVDMPTHVSLQVSGHTHGGQICLPFGVPLHTPVKGRNYVSGFFPDANVPLYVTRGVGTSGVNYRLFCRPEVSILTLRSA
jgi:predicted MPP superfamily phosphohydrolase